MTDLDTITIASGQGAYPVRFLDTFDGVVEAIERIDDCLVLGDRHVADLYPAFFARFRSDRVLLLDATEDEKTLQGVERVGRFLQDHAATKSSRLVVIGGGIIQDIGAFAAHVYYRGIPYTLVPTTLLSMADSCIGAKCGVNLGSFKNQLGFFNSPSQVLLYADFARTLEFADLRSGYGEVLKLAITGGRDAFDRFEARTLAHGLTVEDAPEAIRESLLVKQRIIEEDEYEAGLRKLLNYGHTFAHALETVTHHEVPHGLAVAWGVDIANFVALKKGLLAEEYFERIHAIVRGHFAFELKSDYAIGELITTMARDKKASKGSANLVLLCGEQLKLVPTFLDESFANLLHEYRDTQRREAMRVTR